MTPSFPTRRSSDLQSFGDKFWKDKHGKLAVFQGFNPPLIIWLVASVGNRLFEHGVSHDLMNVVAFGALFTWAYLEITQGDSYFRRLLGLDRKSTRMNSSH